MRLLFEIDTKDYDPNGKQFVRPSARGIIIRDGRLAMIYSQRYRYYKFPGGGIAAGEDRIAALVREVREETGLAVKLETIREYGYVHRIQKGHSEDVFVQDNYYYTCEAEDEGGSPALEEDEKEEQFVPVLVTPEEVIAVNLSKEHGGRTDDEHLQVMLHRETTVVKMLVQDGMFQPKR